MSTAIDINTLAAAKILKKDPPRAEERVKLRVVSRSEGHVIAGHVLSAGEQTVEVYESDVRLFTDSVERKDLGAAKERQARYAQAIEDKAAGKPVADTAFPRYPLSLEAVFREIEGRDLLPLISAKRFEEKAAKA